MFNKNATATVERLQYVDGKADWFTEIGSYRGYFTEMSKDELVDPTMYGRAYHFNTKYGANIKDSDNLIIDGVSYSVQSVMNKKWYCLSFTRCTIIKNAWN